MLSLVLVLSSGLLAVDLGAPPIPPVEPPARQAVAAVLGRLASADPQARLVAATELAAMGDAHYAALVEALFRPRGAPADALRPILLLTGAQVPNWKSSDPLWVRRTEPKWVPKFKGDKRPKRPPPIDPEAVDWLVALNGVDLTHPELAAIDPATKVLAQLEAIEVVALLRAIGGTHRPEAVAPLFRFAFEPEGIFRDECGRQLRAIGDAAVPELVPLQHRAPLPKMRRYAAFQLDRLDRANPKKALAAMPDDRLRAGLLHQYGEVRALDSVEPVLDYVDAESLRVRREARWAWLRFVAGKAPPAAPKRHRKLPGGREETEEKPDYLTYRELAELALQRRLAAELPDLVAGKQTAEELTKRLFAHYDARRAEKWLTLYQSAVAAYDAGERDSALGTMTEILAHEPAFLHRAAIGARLFEQAERERQGGKLERAVSLYRQGIVLLAESDRPRWEARLLVAEGLLGERHGQSDRQEYEEALRLDPTLPEAKRALGHLSTSHPRHVGTTGLVLLGLVGFVLIAAGIAWRRRLRPIVKQPD